MKRSVFKEMITALKEQSEKEHAAYKLGLDVTAFTDPLHEIIQNLVGSTYGKDGVDIFYWWCYEKEWGTREDLTMTDKDGNQLCKTVEELYDYLEENKTDDYDVRPTLTEEEHKQLIETIAFGFGA